jgi:hypothetical protein
MGKASSGPGGIKWTQRRAAFIRAELKVDSLESSTNELSCPSIAIGSAQCTTAESLENLKQ